MYTRAWAPNQLARALHWPGECQPARAHTVGSHAVRRHGVGPHGLVGESGGRAYTHTHTHTWGAPAPGPGDLQPSWHQRRLRCVRVVSGNASQHCAMDGASQFVVMRTAAHAQVPFSWCDAFRPARKVTQHNIHYEKASVLFNLASLSSQQALSSDRTSGDGLTQACKLFQVRTRTGPLLPHACVHARVRARVCGCACVCAPVLVRGARAHE